MKKDNHVCSSGDGQIQEVTMDKNEILKIKNDLKSMTENNELLE